MPAQPRPSSEASNDEDEWSLDSTNASEGTASGEATVGLMVRDSGD
jgi:hypothetical protein